MGEPCMCTVNDFIHKPNYQVPFYSNIPTTLTTHHDQRSILNDWHNGRPIHTRQRNANNTQKTIHIRIHRVDIGWRLKSRELRLFEDYAPKFSSFFLGESEVGACSDAWCRCQRADSPWECSGWRCFRPLPSSRVWKKRRAIRFVWELYLRLPMAWNVAVLPIWRSTCPKCFPEPSSAIIFEQKTASFIASAAAANSASIVDMTVRLWIPLVKLTGALNIMMIQHDVDVPLSGLML